MFPSGTRVLVGFSGGPDSTALLLALDSIKEELGVALIAAHLNHCLRGKESDGDEEFARKLCEKRGIEFVSERVKVERGKGGSLENACRNARHDFFRRMAAETGAGAVALAHTTDDSAETFLLRLFRGSGTSGLAGMASVKDLDGLRIVRPLINCSSIEVEIYLSSLGIIARSDSTNKSQDFTRNRVRMQIIPLIEKALSPSVKSLLSRTARVLQTEDSFMAAEAEKAFRKTARVMDDALSVTFDSIKASELHPSLLARVVRLGYSVLRGPGSALEYETCLKVAALFSRKDGSESLSLPGGIVCTRNYETIVMKKQLSGSESVHVPTGLGNGISARITARPEDLKYPKPGSMKAVLDADKVKFPLSVKRRYRKEKFYPLGASGEMKLKNFFINRKVEKEKRWSIPLVYSADGEIIWVAGVEISDKCKVTPETKHILRLNFGDTILNSKPAIKLNRHNV